MSNPLPVVSSREVIHILERCGFRVIRGRGKGSHVFLFRDHPATGVTVPERKELKRGTLRNIIRQAGLTVDEFVTLLKE